MINPSEFLEEKSKDALVSSISGINRSTIKFIKPDEKIKEVTKKDRLMWAALGGLSGLAATAIMPRLISRIFKSRIRLPGSVVAANVASMGTAGYFWPDVRNTLIEEKKGLITQK